MMKSKIIYENYMKILLMQFVMVNKIKLLFFKNFNYQKHSNWNVNGTFLGCNKGIQVNVLPGKS